MDRLSELSRLRCSACGATPNSPPSTPPAEWGAHAKPCAICQLPVFELIHEIRLGADEEA